MTQNKIYVEDIEKRDVKSKKQQLAERMETKRLGLNYDGEDVLYGSINDDYAARDGELKGYKKNEEKLVEAFNKDPRIANMLLAMTRGENSLLYLIDNFGQEEMRVTLNDPEMKEEIIERQNAYLGRRAKNNKLEEEAKMNITVLLDALKEAKNDLGCGDENVSKAFELFVQIQGDAIVDKIAKETWVMPLKRLNHDIDIRNATHEVEIKGRSAKIDKDRKKKTIPGGIPPQLGGQGALENRAGKKIVTERVLAKYSDDNSDDI